MRERRQQMKRNTIYISIPITGRDDKKQREKADRIKHFLSRKGWNAINPFDIYVGPDATYGDYLGSDVRLIIDHCQAIFMCDGWQESKGCRIERFVAETMGKVIKFESEQQTEIYYR